MVPSPSKCPAKSLGGWGFSLDSSEGAYSAHERLPLVSKGRFAHWHSQKDQGGHVPNSHEDKKSVVWFGDALSSIFSWLFGWT